MLLTNLKKNLISLLTFSGFGHGLETENFSWKLIANCMYWEIYLAL